MSVRFRVFASGRLGDSATPRPINVLYELYRVPDDKAVVINAMRFVNTHTAAVPFTVVLRIGLDRPVFPPDVTLGTGLMLMEEEELTLTEGYAIWAKVGKDGDPNNATYADKIDFVIGGIERDL